MCGQSPILLSQVIRVTRGCTILDHICPERNTIVQWKTILYNATRYNVLQYNVFQYNTTQQMVFIQRCISQIVSYLFLWSWNIYFSIWDNNVEPSLMGPMPDLAKREPWRRSIVRGWLYFTGSSSTLEIFVRFMYRKLHNENAIALILFHGVSSCSKTLSGFKHNQGTSPAKT